GIEQGGDSIEYSGATDADGETSFDCVDLNSAALEKHAFDGARSGAHAVPYMRSFKSGPRRTVKRQRAAVHAQCDFVSGARVDAQKRRTQLARAGADANNHGPLT